MRLSLRSVRCGSSAGVLRKRSASSDWAASTPSRRLTKMCWPSPVRLQYRSAAITAIAPFIPPSTSAIGTPIANGRPPAGAFIVARPPMAWAKMS